MKPVVRAGVLLVSFAAIITFTGILSGCLQAELQEFTFQTISQDVGFSGDGRGYGGTEPNMLIIADPGDISSHQLDLVVPGVLADQLTRLDYKQYFAVIVLGGVTGWDKITVTRVARQGMRIVIEAEYFKPTPEGRIFPMTHSPYHLVVVNKGGSWGRDTWFVLNVGGNIWAEDFHYVP